MAGCGRPVVSEHSLVVSWNGTWAVYECPEGYRHQSGQLTRQCVNNTWTGQDPACTVDSVLPKAYLVMLIIGATLSVFVACIPYDFYRFRRRKKAARKHQERLSLMTRIAPGHAKMTETLPVHGALPNAQRRFGFRSLIKAFRFVAEKMKTTNGEEDAETGTTVGVGEATASSAGNNGGLVSGSGGSSKGDQPPPIPNDVENRAAKMRMSAVLSLWTGRGQRAKSLDISDDPPTRPSLRPKRNSLIAAAATSAIQTAATTAATAVTAATASRGSYDDLADVMNSTVNADDRGTLQHTVELTPSPSVDSSGSEPGSQAAHRFPHIGSARYVQLAASIPEDTDETEDGACVGGRFKVTERKNMMFSNSLPSSWGEVKATSSWGKVKATSPAVDTLNVAPLTQENVAALADGSVMTCKSRDSDTTDSTQGRLDTSSERNSLTLSDGRLMGADCGDPLTGPPRSYPIQRQPSQDLDSHYDHRTSITSSSYGHRTSVTSSLATDDSDRQLDGPTRADIH